MGNEWNRWWSGRGAGGERPPEELARPTSQSKNDPEAAAEPDPVESKIDPNTLPDATGTKSENADAPIGETLPASGTGRDGNRCLNQRKNAAAS